MSTLPGSSTPAFQTKFSFSSTWRIQGLYGTLSTYRARTPAPIYGQFPIQQINKTAPPPSWKPFTWVWRRLSSSHDHCWDKQLFPSKINVLLIFSLSASPSIAHILWSLLNPFQFLNIIQGAAFSSMPKRLNQNAHSIKWSFCHAKWKGERKQFYLYSGLELRKCFPGDPFQPWNY